MLERIKRLRDSLNLTQKEFADKIKLGQSTWAMIESDNRRINERHIKLICQEFNVSELWLKTGEGEMFISESSDILDAIGQKCNLDASDKALIRAYLDLNEFEKKLVKDFALKIAHNINSVKNNN